MSSSHLKSGQRWNHPVAAIALLCSVGLFSAAGFGQGQEPPSFHHSSTLKTDLTGTPRAIYRVQSPQYPGTPDAAARTFLTERRDLLEVESASSALMTRSVETIPGGTHVRFQQIAFGIPVYRGEVVVSLNERNQVTLVISNVRADAGTEGKAAVYDATGAIRRAREILRSEARTVGRPPHAELVWYREGNGAEHLAFRVTMVLEQPAGDWELLIDAVTGAELRREDRFVRHRDTITHANGTGYVYRSNPLSAARKAYGSPGFEDGEDADTDSLRAYRQLVTLDSLAVVDGEVILSGPYCTVTDIESPPDPARFTSSSPDGFRYDRSQPGFEAVMAYYHITKAHRRLIELGFSSPSLANLLVDPHGYQGSDNSHYSPSGNWIAFGTGGVDDAEDADVIWHEFGHAIHYNIVPTWGGGEAGSLGEGYGDYWAASYTRSLGEWNTADPQFNWLFVWDGHNPFWSGRVLNDGRRYPFGNLSVHSAGQIWSSALLGIRDEVGRDVADRLVIKSLYYLGAEATAVDAAQAILQADRDLYGGTHVPTLLFWLSTIKNFIPSADSSMVLVVNDDATGSGPLKTRSSQELFAMATPPAGHGLRMTSFANLDTAILSGCQAIVLVGGRNPRPFDNPVKRRAIVKFVEAGGKVIVEGGQAASYYGRTEAGGELDGEFRKTILSCDRFLGDATDASLVLPASAVRSGSAGGPFFSTPHRLQAPLAFAYDSGPSTREAVSPEVAGNRTIGLGGWSTAPGAFSAIAHASPDGSIATLFLPFAVSALQDSSLAGKLIENALHYVLFHRSSGEEYLAEAPPEPEEFRLHQNYPNPFNPSTTITIDLAQSATVRLEVYSILGQRVRTLVSGTGGPGRQSYQWDGTGETGVPVSSGTYIVRLEVRTSVGDLPAFVQSRRILLLR